MSSPKAVLKAIGDSIRQQKWDDAIQQAQDFIKREPKNFQAHLFLAFALDKKNKLSDSEEIYLAAASLKPEDSQPWQGLIKLYQKQGALKLPGYRHAALKLAERYRDVDELYKCQDVIDKFIEHAKSHGDQSQYIEALEIILPGSPIYPTLEGRVPHPARTYETIAQFIETDEKKRINTLIGERRTRIGARISEVTIEVKREILGKSKLGGIYRELINWTNDDELRRVYEEKLLQHCHERLLAFPQGQEKTDELEIVQKLANDMVVIKHPFRLAWDITIDWKDHKEIGDWDVTVLRDYCTFFPETDLYKVITGYLTSSISPFPQQNDKSSTPAATDGDEDESEDDEEGGAPTAVVPITDEDRILMMTEGIVSANSLLAYRMMGEYYQHLEEWESNVELMRKAKDYLAVQKRKLGLKFQNTEAALLVYLGTALVFYQSPRNHQEAKALFDSVLERDPTATAALIGVGLVYEEEEEYDEAIAFLERALKRDPENLRVRAEAAWVKALKGDYSQGLAELAACVLLIEKAGASSKGLLAQTQYRLGTCIWNVDTSRAARKNRGGAYAQFLAALRNDLNYAPAYTSLGVYYAEYGRDKNRARKCFLKAVELSPSEVEAAERLARSFADEGDWDRVELVAQRVVDSGKVKPPPGSKRKGLSWPFAALGVAELNKQDYARAIVSFQSALRINPEDYHCWVGLGESYYNSGRYMAATKTILNAQRLEETLPAGKVGDTWFTKFLLANVKRELGEFDEAIALYREAIGTRPGEDGVSIALMQTMVESAQSSLERGLFGKAVGLATETLEFAAEKMSSSLSETFNFWRAVGDSCAVFSTLQSRVADFPTETVRRLIPLDDDRPEYQVLREVDGVGTRVVLAKGLFPEDESAAVDLTRCLHACILAHKYAVHVSAHDVHAQSVAYFNLGWAEHRAHTCLPASLRRGNGKPSRYLRASMRCFKRAIELEAGNAEFWDALGVVTSSHSPAVAQHALVRSLHLNERSAATWANLGALVLGRGDGRLANEAFTRAQSADPDYAPSWVGQGFVALMFGDPREARALFTHAMGMAGAGLAVARQMYAAAMFDHVKGAGFGAGAAGVGGGAGAGPPPIAQLLLPVFALSQLRALRPAEVGYAHLEALMRERVGRFGGAVDALEGVVEALRPEGDKGDGGDVQRESREEEGEDGYAAGSASRPQALAKFVLAQADLARAHLAARAYGKAIACAEKAAAGASGGGPGGVGGGDAGLTGEERDRVRLSAYLTLGLAHYYSGSAGEAVRHFEHVLEEMAPPPSSSGNALPDPDAVCLLAQVLWATGAEEGREQARDRLFEVVGERPDHVQSVLLLGAIALLDDDAESLEAVAAELQGLRASEGVGAAEQARISEVLRAAALLLGGGGGGGDDDESVGGGVVEDARTQAQTDIMLHPHMPHGWANLAAAVEGGDGDDVSAQEVAHAAGMAVELARKAIAPRGDLGAEDLARAYAGTGRAVDAQVAVAVAPWLAEGWVSLADCVAGA